MIISLSHLIPWLLAYRYLFLFPAAVLEGPIVAVIAGFLSSQDYFSISTVLATLVAGDLVGDTLYYALGRWGRVSFIERWGKYVGVTAEHIRSVDEHFKKHAGKTLMLGKLAHGIGGAILVAAGATAVPYRKFIWFNLLATVPKSLVLVLIGYYIGQAYARIGRYLDYTAWGMLILAAVSILAYWGMRTGARTYENPHRD